MKKFIFKYCYIYLWIIYLSLLILPPIFIHLAFIFLSLFSIFFILVIIEFSDFLKQYFHEKLQIEKNNQLYREREIQNKLFKEFGRF
jgi:hypothetical protein